MQYHNTLEKQIQTVLSPDLLEHPAIRTLLKQVDLTYKQYEHDKQVSLQAFAITEKEYQDVLNNLLFQNNVYHDAIKRLKSAVLLLDPQAPIGTEKDTNDLAALIAYLEKQVQKRKTAEEALAKKGHSSGTETGANNDFFAVMSHEIRTPLNAIIGLAHILLQDELLPAQAEYLKALNSSAENLLTLVNDILDFKKIESGALKLVQKKMDLRQLVNHIEMAHRSRAGVNGNTIKLLIDPQLPAYVLGDDTRITQILNNLVSNAVKFTNNGTITIEMAADHRSHNQVSVHFSVTDTGIGIEKEDQESLFDRFNCAQRGLGYSSGSGIGLAIVKKLAALHGSDVYVTSEPDHGSVFYFTIPFTIETAPVLPIPNHHADLSGVNVLLVEDVAFNILVAQKMITNWNGQVDIAENGLQAVSMVREKSYDIVLMDLQMPVMNGYEASRHIRDFNDQIPIIAITASAWGDTLKRTREAGMNGYLAKPFKPAELLDIINRYAVQVHRTPA